MGDGRFCDASSRHHLASDVHQSVEEGAGGDHHALRPDLRAPDGCDAHGLALFDDELVGLVLPDVQMVGFIEHTAPFPDEFSTVALCTRAPHGRSFASVEHAELDGGGIGNEPHLSAQGIYLAHNLSFGNAANGRIARHLGNLVHVHGHQTGAGPHVSRGRSRLASGVSTANHYYIVVQCHSLWVIFSVRGCSYRNSCCR